MFYNKLFMNKLCYLNISHSYPIFCELVIMFYIKLYCNIILSWDT